MLWPALPRTLVLLLLASLTLARAPPTSTNDPLYDVAKLAPKVPEQPICCLVPLPSNEPAEEILSFEDWKAKQLLVQGDGRDAPKPPQNVNAQEPALDSLHVEVSVPPQTSQHELPVPSRLRVPIVDRFNYANLDCSARVHNSHRSAKSPSSILSSKKDRYMLSPCNTPGDEKFVVVELCEDISIDTVQLANFEFFSGIFKDFTVKVAKTLTSDDSWTFAGTYTAKNIRGVQTFHLPVSVRDFYRFIRIEFHSNYGNEFYCPVSLLRVYGLTHLEQYKWEEWEAESRASRKGEVDENIATAVASLPVEDVPSQTEQQSHSEETINVSKDLENVPSTNDSPASDRSEPPESTPGVQSTEVTPDQDSVAKTAESSSEDSAFSVSTAASDTTSTTSAPDIETPGSDHESSIPSDEPLSHESSIEAATAAPSPSHASSSSMASDNSTLAKTSTTTSLPTFSSATGSMPIVVPHLSHSVPAVTSPGESIYRTIMTRLTSLETNSSLYLRYVEEQSRSLREALRRLEEDVGRLEGIGKAQSQFFQRTMQDWDKQRKRLEREHGELLSRVNFLSDEVVLEKRLGIAQLCLLLIVLLFMFITRGSRGESLIEAIKSERHSSLREWGRRQLSNFSSGEWNVKTHPRPSSPLALQRESPAKLPSQQSQEGIRKVTKLRSRDKFHLANPPMSPVKHRPAATARSPAPRQTVFHRPRTPVTPRVFGTPALAPSSAAQRPLLRRASSHNSPALTLSYSAGSSPLSTKKWAKTSHLHEVRRTPKFVPTSPQDENTDLRSLLSPRIIINEENGECSPPNPIKSQPSLDGDVFSSGIDVNPITDQNNIASNDLDGAEYRKPLSLLQNRHNNDLFVGRSLLGSPWQPQTSHTEGEAEAEIWIDTDLESEAGE